MARFLYTSGTEAKFANSSEFFAGGSFNVAMYTSFEDLTADAAYLFDNTITNRIICEDEIVSLYNIDDVYEASYINEGIRYRHVIMGKNKIYPQSYFNRESVFKSTYDDSELGNEMAQLMYDTMENIFIKRHVLLKSQMDILSSFSNNDIDNRARRVVFGKMSINNNNNPILISGVGKITGHNRLGEERTADFYKLSTASHSFVIVPERFKRYDKTIKDKFLIKITYFGDTDAGGTNGYKYIQQWEYIGTEEKFISENLLRFGYGVVLPFGVEQHDTVGSRYNIGYRDLHMQNRQEYCKLTSFGPMSNAGISIENYNEAYLFDYDALELSGEVSLNYYKNDASNMKQIKEKGAHILMKDIILVNPGSNIITKCVDYDTNSKNIDFTQYIYEGCLYLGNFMIGHVEGDILQLVCKFNNNGVLSDYVVVTFAPNFKYLQDILIHFNYTGYNVI